jgi:hypothetical protein
MDQIADVRMHLKDEDATVWEAETLSAGGIRLSSDDLVSVVEQAMGEGVTEFYLTDEDSDASPGVAFFHNGTIHTAFLSTEGSDDVSEEGISQITGGFGTTTERDEEDEERKQELASELLQQYDDYLTEEQRHRLEERLGFERVTNLLRMREELQEKARADPELEEEAAAAIADDERFNRQFNETDTETLLRTHYEFDMDKLRFEKVHKQAKSLLKIQ